MPTTSASSRPTAPSSAASISRCSSVYSDTGMMGGSGAHEFMLLADGGEDTLLVCPSCGYAANQEVATFDKGAAADSRSDVSDTPHEVHTPGATTIAALCEAFGCAADATLKSVFYATGDHGEELVLAVIRGDLDVNDIKLRNLLGREVRALSHAEAVERGLDRRLYRPGRPHLSGPLTLVADDSVLSAGDLVAGANRADYHLTGVRYGRDFSANFTGDHRHRAGGPSLRHLRHAPGGAARHRSANTFKLGTLYSASMGATWVDEAGASHPFIMGCYGLGITRALACLIEQHHDANGIVWPPSVAPYRYHLLTAGNDPAARAAADQLYASLGADDTLYDDRDLSTGIKFKDADLLGMPLRVTVSPRSLAAGGAELRLRRTGETRIVPFAGVPQASDSLLLSISPQTPTE